MNVCKDCEPRNVPRPCPHPGPRCYTHHRAKRKADRDRRHELDVARIYGLAPGEYEARYIAQGGVCAICRRATGRTKRLAVDHDHTDGHVRGLLCGPCNSLIGRYSPEALARAIHYLHFRSAA